MEDGWLPNNVAALGRIAKAPNRSWWRIWPGLKGFFTVSEDGKWITQKRLMKELEKARKRKAKEKTGTAKMAESEGEESAKMAHAKMAGSDCQDGTVSKGNPAKMPKTTSAKSLTHARARVPLPKKDKEKEKEKEMGQKKKGAAMAFVAIASPQWRAWQQVKLTPTIFSAEHHANGWWFPSEWPPDLS